MARLTIPDEQTFAEFTVVTSTSVFPISFSLFAKEDLTVLIDDVDLGQSGFTFSGTVLDGGGYDGGTVTLNTAVTRPLRKSPAKKGQNWRSSVERP
jgi:hypothetical protein